MKLGKDKKGGDLCSTPHFAAEATAPCQLAWQEPKGKPKLLASSATLSPRHWRQDNGGLGMNTSGRSNYRDIQQVITSVVEPDCGGLRRAIAIVLSYKSRARSRPIQVRRVFLEAFESV